MKWLAMLTTLLVLSNCHYNGRDAIESHQIIAEPKTFKVHWTQDPIIDVTEDKTKVYKPCQRLVH